MRESLAVQTVLNLIATLDSNTRERRSVFEERMAVARRIVDIHPPGLLSLIRLIGRRVQAEELSYVVDLPEHKRPKDADFDSLFFSPTAHLTQNGDCYRSFIREQEGPYYKLQLGRDLVLPWPWNKDRIVDSLSLIGFGKKCGPWKAELNHRVQLVLPVGIGLVGGGNHSLAAGIVNGEGEVINTHVIDLSLLYSYVRYDGISYRRTVDSRVIRGNPNHDMGAIFEIGRLMVEHGVEFDSDPVDKAALETQKKGSDRYARMKYRVICNDELQLYEVTDSAIVNCLLEAGVERGSAKWDAVLRGADTLTRKRAGKLEEWRFEAYMEKPLYQRIL